MNIQNTNVTQTQAHGAHAIAGALARMNRSADVAKPSANKKTNDAQYRWDAWGNHDNASN